MLAGSAIIAAQTLQQHGKLGGALTCCLCPFRMPSGACFGRQDSDLYRPTKTNIYPDLAPYSAANPSWVSHALRSEEHTSELQSQSNLVCRLLLEKKKPPTR